MISKRHPPKKGYSCNILPKLLFKADQGVARHAAMLLREDKDEMEMEVTAQDRVSQGKPEVG